MKREIIVPSIFEGMMPSGQFGGENEYLMGLGIDPDVPLTDDPADIRTGGFIRPVNYSKFSGSEIDAMPVAILTTPQSDLTWVILANGKIIAYESDLTSSNYHLVGQVAGSHARGAWYYNNYIYIAGTGTAHDDLSRVGPLNCIPFDNQTTNFTVGATLTGGTSGATAIVLSQTDSGTTGHLVVMQIKGMFLDNETITDSSNGAALVNRTFASMIVDGVWKGATLGAQTGLGDPAYPKTLLDIRYINHFGLSHSDGASYFLDFKDGLGYIHKIQTTKSTYQGDTNDGSAYQSVGDLSLPSDFIPITMASYGIDIVVSGTPTVDNEVNQGNAWLFFWDAAEELFYRRIPLSEPLCSALWYVNGVLYGLSGDLNGGYRLFRYIGGDSVEYLKSVEDGNLPLQMATSYVGNRLVWAANTTQPRISAGIYAYGSKSDLFPRGLHHIAISEF